jgi:ABC-type transporter Mla subunit MlaD
MATTAFSGSPGSVSAVVEMVQGELDSLLQRRKEIRARIQNLHQVINGLQGVRGADWDNLRSESCKPASARRTGHLANSGMAAGDHTTGERRSLVSSSTKYSHPALRRACRIALLEGQKAASVTEIYSRIARRGSFPFDSVRLALPLLARTLNIMTEEGEIRCFKDVTSCRWQRICQAGEF